MADTKGVTVESLLQDLEAAHARMSVHNPHRQLLSACGQVLVQMATQIVELRTQLGNDHAAPPKALVLTDA